MIGSSFEDSAEKGRRGETKERLIKIEKKGEGRWREREGRRDRQLRVLYGVTSR